MTDEQNLPDAPTEKKESRWNWDLAEMEIKAIGGVGFATFISLVIGSDIPKVLTATAIGRVCPAFIRSNSC